jgi:hypothetical protein
MQIILIFSLTMCYSYHAGNPLKEVWLSSVYSTHLILDINKIVTEES